MMINVHVYQVHHDHLSGYMLGSTTKNDEFSPTFFSRSYPRSRFLVERGEKRMFSPMFLLSRKKRGRKHMFSTMFSIGKKNGARRDKLLCQFGKVAVVYSPISVYNTMHIRRRRMCIIVYSPISVFNTMQIRRRRMRIVLDTPVGKYHPVKFAIPL